MNNNIEVKMEIGHRQHVWRHYDTAQGIYPEGYYSSRAVRVDMFHCEHCLEMKEVKREVYLNQGDKLPDWYSGER